MEINFLKVGYLQTNCYIVSKDNNCLVIDPGDEASKIINYLKNNNLDLIGIIITHHHEDHIGALSDLLNYKQVSVYDYDNMDEQEYTIGPFTFEVIYTLGHTLDSITIYFNKEKVMFVGDFIFEGCIGRTDLGGNMTKMLESIQKISLFNDNITIYPGHGNATNLGKEKKTNPYFI